MSAAASRLRQREHVQRLIPVRIGIGDAAAARRLMFEHLVQGESTNIKVTFAEDLQVAEMILARQGRITL